MHLTKSAILAILAFGTASLANIFPDQDPCNPAPALEGEYQGEFDARMDLDDQRCSCLFPGPAPGEQQDEFDARNQIDSGRCGPADVPPPAWFDPGPPIDLGPIVVPWVGGGRPGWRNPGGWRDERWRGRGGPGRPGGRHFDRGSRHRGEPGRGFPGRGPVGPGRGPERGPEPHRGPEPVHRPEPIHRPEPVHRPEPPRPVGHPGGRPGHY